MLVDALARADRDGAVVTLSLEALTRGEADELLDDELPDSARTVLFVQSGGNPFYLQELARGSPARAAVAAADVPRSVALALDQEVRALPEEAQRLARAAVVGATRWSSMSRSQPPSLRRARR